MITSTSTRDLIDQYIDALSGKPKTADTIKSFVSDPVLLEHILATEAAFPDYEIRVDQIVTEGDTAALRGTFYGTHQGPFASMPATGRHISAGLMIFYRVSDGLISQHWMQLDSASLFQQLTATA